MNTVFTDLHYVIYVHFSSLVAVNNVSSSSKFTVCGITEVKVDSSSDTSTVLGIDPCLLNTQDETRNIILSVCTIHVCESHMAHLS